MRVSPPASPLAPEDLGSSCHPSGPAESQTCLPAAGPKFSTQILMRTFTGREGRGSECETKYHFANESDEAEVPGPSHDVFVEKLNPMLTGVLKK